MKRKIALIFGGRSAEHEVSLNSAKNIFTAMDTNLFDVQLIGISKEGTWYQFANSDVFKKHKSLNDSRLTDEDMVTLISIGGNPYFYSFRTQERRQIDCAFPIIHGTMGEDGTLQGLFKVVQLPFVGCDVLASAVGMDKEFMKRLMTESGIKNSKYLILRRENMLPYNEIVKELGSPFFIKPANAGSSVGVHKIKTEDDYMNKISDSFLYDHKVLAEQFNEGAEVECSVLGLNQKPKASLPGQLKVHHEFYSYEAKYIDAKGAEIIIPAPLPENQIREIQELAVKTFKSLGCDGLARVDFFVNKNGEILVNEINTLPGFTQISMYPKMWEASGLKYSALITELIQIAFEKFSNDRKLKLDFN
ncbi:MAG: D-alanine--D-alanine ligase A [Bdellovibrionales bacterium RIFCSPHIGHO2_01_FULL_40_29]|nr:MAG: D-alanine--D-alanine ligase A [Bdellovibrionales bacterium RIFCSPHIGHO2_01_FULL_40_29]OFZ34146.1 MAG: D-alanine--D-alanine ligase A [Bdellovibrionales bacterium RIFCSPHIGHO2_02_FULL_40_15]